VNDERDRDAGAEGAPEGVPEDEAVEMPVDGVLDLHTFRPQETRELVPEYLDLCRERGILDVRIIHGKGVGVQREIVHAVLRRHPAVIDFGHPTDQGSWGATVVRLAPLTGD
jgi:DNA-nicking Smr family endonuclease